jgi:hypothetical protein
MSFKKRCEDSMRGEHAFTIASQAGTAGFGMRVSWLRAVMGHNLPNMARGEKVRSIAGRGRRGAVPLRYGHSDLASTEGTHTTTLDAWLVGARSGVVYVGR